MLLRVVVSNAKFKSIEELLDIVKTVGQELTNSQPKELAIGNVTRRVLRLIREEYQQALRAANLDTSEPALRMAFKTPDLYGVNSAPSLGSDNTPLRSPSSAQRPSHPTNMDDFNRKSTTVMIQAIQEVIDEIETVYEQVSKNASSHIRATDVVLTFGKSKTVESFIKSAASASGGLTVYVAETAPFYTGREMVKSLSEQSGIECILIPDSSIFAVMPRITKVVLGTHAVLSNGGLISQSGSYLTCAIAELHATPVICVTGQFKLSSIKDNLEENDFSSSDYVNSAKMVNYDDGNVVNNVDVAVPYYEYVKPEFISVFITNDGEFPPFTIHRYVNTNIYMLLFTNIHNNLDYYTRR